MKYMKKLSLFILACICTLGSYADDVAVFNALVNRLLPNYSSQITGKKLPEGKNDYFQLSSVGDRIEIAGNNANSMAVGLNYYLKYYCNTNVSWFVDDHLDMPATLPAVDKKVTVDARCKDRFFLNYCTFGYTMPWWQWEDWEHFIDWMALNGINLPLAITGQESIWLKVWTKLGLSESEVRNYFTGPAHLPWHRMLNIDYWQGNLPMSWLDGQEELQKKIVARERELNMKPVLPAFAGHVPQELKRIYPDAKITKLGGWAGYSHQYACSFLDPMDPLFTKIQKMFLEEQNSIYGTDHIYGIDLFNELEAPSYEPSYLRRVSRQVYQSLEKADKKAVWLQMTWLFWNEKKDWTNERIKAYITAFPSKKSLLLDYYCERHEVWQQTDKYFGVPYIWCYLGNFGGNTVLVGNLYDINKRLENTFANGGKNFEGLGSTLEGFDCNPFVYNYVFEKAWDIDIHKDVPRWTEELAVRRIGRDNAKGKTAWKLLIDSIYADPSRPGQCAMLSIRPTFGKFKTYYANPRFRYSNKTLLSILGLMLEADGKGTSYSFDVVNVTRQLLGNYFWAVFKDYEKAYQKGDFKTMKAKEQLMLGILSDMDRVLSTQSAFLMGKWISDARKLGANEKEKLYFEQNARNLLTTWGEKASLLNDYASRSWSGLISTFYAERWKMFFAAVDRAVLAGQNFDDAKYEDYKKDVTEYEERWWKDCIGTFPEQPVGNSVIISKELYDKYKPLIEEM